MASIWPTRWETKIVSIDGLSKYRQIGTGSNYVLIQFFVDLGKAWSGGVVEQLRAQGYCLGGLLPVWFGDDGLLMQKHFVDPEFASLKIFTDRGRSLVEMVRRDWERSKQ